FSISDPYRSGPGHRPGRVRPGRELGGNVTGLSVMTMELNSKRLQLLKEVTPQLTRAAVLWNPDHPSHSKVVEDLNVVARSLSIKLSPVGLRTPEQFAQAFSEVSQAQAQALYVVEDPIFFAHRVSLLQLASAARLPTIHELRRFPEAGALMSYGPDLHDLFRRSAIYVDRIFKGAKPADLPVEQPTKFDLVINLITAKALGLEVPPTLLARAVIFWSAMMPHRVSNIAELSDILVLTIARWFLSIK